MIWSQNKAKKGSNGQQFSVATAFETWNINKYVLVINVEGSNQQITTDIMNSWWK